jgi:hypothetical protein
MTRTLSLHARVLVAAAALICNASSAADPAEDAIAQASSAQLRAAYLECARLSADGRLGTSMMLTCKSVADVLLHRDFGGDLDRQLHWWRQAHAEAVVGAAARH